MSNLEVKAMRFLEDDPIDPDCIKRSEVCEGEPFFGEHEGKRYCVLHFPGADKKDDFDIAFKRKLDSHDSYYGGVWFPAGDWFAGLEIRQPLDFTSAFFNGRASFYKTTFRSSVDFEGATFNDARFGYARFEEDANFWGSTFRGAVDFGYAAFLQTANFPSIFHSAASFSNASFVRADFGLSEFKDKAEFKWCTFGSAEFIGASFRKEVDFFDSRFEGMANFTGATFDAAAQLRLTEFSAEARFTSAAFNGEADFSHTVFKAFGSFSAEDGSGGFGRNAACDFRHARFEAPRRVSFHSLTLRPHWFVNLDPREFEFVDVKWIGNLRSDFIDVEIQELKKREELEQKKAADSIAERLKTAEQDHDEFEIERLKRYEVEEARVEVAKVDQKRTRFYRLLSIACRQLAVNAEENHRYDQASDFRFWSMELQRKEGWRARSRSSIGILHTLYRYLSGYGEEIGRAFLVLLGIWLLFALLYTRVGFVQPPSTVREATVSQTNEVGTPQKPTKALAYSLAVITLQRPEPRPLTATAWFAVLAETILGPIQAALLILAVRRRFMR